MFQVHWGYARPSSLLWIPNRHRAVSIVGCFRGQGGYISITMMCEGSRYVAPYVYGLFLTLISNLRIVSISLPSIFSITHTQLFGDGLPDSPNYRNEFTQPGSK